MRRIGSAIGANSKNPDVVTLPRDVVDELVRVSMYASCQVCEKQYKDDPRGDCLLEDHIEGHRAVMAYRKAVKP